MLPEISGAKRWGAFTVCAVLSGTISDALGLSGPMTAPFIVVLTILLVIPVAYVGAWAEGR